MNADPQTLLRLLEEIETEAFFTVAEQTELFLLSVVMGGCFGVLFDVFRALRVLLPPLKGSVATAVGDIIFFCICGFGIYVFSLLFAGGEVRGYYWVGAFLGGVIYLMTVGTVVMGIFHGIFDRLYRILNKILVRIGKFIKKIFTKVSRRIKEKFVFNAKKHKENKENFQKDLKKTA
ncbi:MAG: spore cortex biosynthesis protein YabQ [Oscillospiraceae bacterium]|nr:spore cortex biosynthesis protein YabQ [Oscillospiraceae bacterium]